MNDVLSRRMSLLPEDPVEVNGSMERIPGVGDRDGDVVMVADLKVAAGMGAAGVSQGSRA